MRIYIVFMVYFERCDTQYAQGFSWAAFLRVHEGDSVASLLQRLGEPSDKKEMDTVEEWDYGKVRYTIHYYRFNKRKVDLDVVASEEDGKRRIEFVSVKELKEKYGDPKVIVPGGNCEYWGYSYSPTSTNYLAAAFLVDKQAGIILRKYGHFYWD